MLYKTAWKNLIGTNEVKSAISSRSIRGANISCDEQYPYISLSINIAIVFGTSVNNNCVISIYSVDRDSSTTDTSSLWQQRIKSYANSERIITIPNLNVSSLDTIRVEVKNNNTTSTIYTCVSYKAAYNK